MALNKTHNKKPIKNLINFPFQFNIINRRLNFIRGVDIEKNKRNLDGGDSTNSSKAKRICRRE